MITQRKEENQERRSGIREKVEETIEANEADIAREKEEIQTKGEVIKQKVKEQKDKWLPKRMVEQVFKNDDE